LSHILNTVHRPLDTPELEHLSASPRLCSVCACACACSSRPDRLLRITIKAAAVPLLTLTSALNPRSPRPPPLSLHLLLPRLVRSLALAHSRSYPTFRCETVHPSDRCLARVAVHCSTSQTPLPTFYLAPRHHPEPLDAHSRQHRGAHATTQSAP